MRGKRTPLLIILFLSLSMLLSATQYAHADTDLVPPPTNLAAAAKSSSEIDLSWTAPTGVGLVVSGYQIDRSTDGGLTWTVPYVAATGSTATTYADTNLPHSTPYTYRVHTIVAGQTSFPSNTASATTLAVAPSSPTGLTATVASSSQINLSWTAPADNGGSAITGYQIDRSTDGGSTWSSLVNTCGTSTSCSDTGLAHATTFTYRVSAINSIGASPPSTTASATTLAVAPSSPSGLAATAVSPSQINLSWTAPTDNGGSAITGYKIERSTDGGTTWGALVANTGSTATTYSDTGLAHTTTYTYKISAINSIGTSSASSTVSATTPIATPSPPTALATATVSSSQLNLSWTAPTDNGGSGITGYKIERSADGGTTWSTLVSNSGSTATAYSDTGLTRATSYTYRVSAINSVGAGSPSSTVSGTTLALAPSSPSGLAATAASSSQISLSWTAPTDNGGSAITGYKIERSADGGTTWLTIVANTGSAATTYSDTGVAHTTTYTYRVSAINSVGTGSSSTTASATTPIATPSPPTGLAATAASSSQISLSWTAPADNGGSSITGYKIERSANGGSTWSTLVSNTGSTATTYSDTGLTHTTTYTYRVSAINSVGTGSPSTTAYAATLAVAPSSPSGLAATAMSPSQIGLSWSAPTDNGGSAITGYKVERSNDGGTTWTTLVATTGSATTSYSDAGVTHTTTYTYRISAINAIGTSSPSTTASATTPIATPSPPTGLTATTVSSSQISLSWTAPTDNGGSAITGYKIERSTDGGSTWSTLIVNAASTTTTYLDTGLTRGTPYTYRVSAINSVGTGSPSSTASATTLALPPSPPTGLAATAASSSQISLSWTAPTDNGGSAITGYKIERSTDGGTTWLTIVANTGSAATTYSDTGVAHTTTYTYRVSAINSVGTGSPSNTVSATTPIATPSPPTGLAATSASPSQITLSWSAPTDNGGSAITGYKVERSNDGGTTWSTLVANTGSAATTYPDTGLTHTTTYTYRVSAINSAGTGSPSSTASATTLAVAPSPPTGFTATAASPSQITLSWSAPTDNGGSAITGYKVERSNDGGTTWSILVANTGTTGTTYSDAGVTHTTTYTYRISAINAIGTSSPSTTASATTPIATPSPPTGLTATAASSTQIGLSWSAPTDNGGSAITGYKIERSTDSGTTWSTIVANTGSATTTYFDVGLTRGTAYTYRVSAINSAGTGSPSSTASATTFALAPSPPTGLAATAGSSSQITLSWTAPTDNGGSAITGYKIERSTDGGTTWTTLVASTGSALTTYSDTGLAHTTTYTYRVSAINSIGTSSASSMVSVTTPIATPSPPTGLAATTVSSSQVTLSWTAPADNGGSAITGYKIERSTDGGSTWSTLVSNSGSTATTYSDTGLTHTTTYTYRISAINSAGTGSPSSTASATTLAVAPSSPSGLITSAVSPSQIGLSWTAPADNGGSAITGYKVERSTDGGTTWSTLASNTGSSTTTYSDIGLTHTTTYTYRVSTINAIGTSPPSATASAATPIATPSPPTGLTVTTVSSSQISLSWSAPTDNGGSAIIGYKVERSTDSGSTWSILIANTGSTATAYSDTGLTHTTTYTYRVSAINSVGTGSPSSTASATTLAVAPSPPTGLSATATSSSSQINLSWTAPADNGGSAITGYMIERSTDGGTTWTVLVANTGSAATTYSNVGLSPNTSFTYRVSGTNAIGTSPPSTTASATTFAVAPSAPTGLTATAASSSQIGLSWTAPNNGGSAITGYKVERSTDGGTTWSTIMSNSGSTATTYSDTGLAAGISYTYRVSAINTVGVSSPSNTASATTLAVAPSSPTGLTATVASSSQINLSWTTPNNGGSAITGYRVERSADGGSTWATLISNTGSVTTTYSDTGPSHSTTYTYRVSAINSVGTSSPSTTTSATTPAVTASPLTGLTATAASSSQINLSWTAPADNGGSAVTGYMIERSADGGSTWSTLVANTGSTATTYSDTGLGHSTTYSYRVSSINAVGTSSPSNPASATTLAFAPSTPSALTATTILPSSQINLSWTAPADNGGSAVTGYMIERSANGGSTWSTIVSNSGSTATTYSDIGLAHGTTYTYRVSAINSVGTGSPSSTASATTPAVAPSPPTGLTATAMSSSQISLSWTPPTDNGGSSITGYKVERSADGGTTWSTLVGNTGSATTTYSDTGLAHTASYTYRVSAINSIGTGSPSSTASATTPAVAPSLPTGLTATAVSSSQINLSWTSPGDNGGSSITGYKVERSTDGGTTWTTLVANTGITGTTYSDTGLTRGTTYTYRVSAINSIGTSSPSGTASANTFAVVPSPPTGLAAAVASSSQINLSWTAPTDNGGSAITGYKVERSTDGGTTWSTLVGNTGSATTTYSDTGLARATAYAYRVSAINSVGTGTPSSTTSATTTIAPSPPTGLTASAASSSQINLSWTAPADNGGSAVTGYMIERSANGGSTWSTIVSNSGSTATTYSDIGLAHGTTYTYRVSAINSVGTGSPSSTASATTPAVAPSPPTGLTATAMSSSQISLSWTPPTDNGGSSITGYKVERSADGGTTWSTLVGNTGSATTTYSDTGLAPDTAYAYRVSAINAVGTSPPSSNTSATTLVTPSPPIGLTATATSSSQINLSWTAPSDNGGSAITGYKIERSANGGSAWTTIVSNSGSTSTTYSDTGLAAGTTYTYRVSAINSVGTGSPSSTASANTLAVAPSPPTGLAATAVSSSQINLSWTAPNNGGSPITGYKIERSIDGGTTWSTLIANTGITGTTYTDTGLAHTTTYTYRVSAINSVGTSPPSNVASATTSVVASPPSGLTATAASSSQINLSWTAPADNGGSSITGYKVERSADGGYTWTTLAANTGSTATTYSDTGLTHATTYTYRVSANNAIGTSPPSTTASATTFAIAPSSPSALAATAVSSSQINLSWTAPADNGGSAITGYMIERSADGGSTWTTIVSNSGVTSTTYSDAGLAAGTTYTYRVSAINSVGTSLPSGTASAPTLAVAPSSPTGLTATAMSSSQIFLSWSAPNNGGSAITGYKVERSADGGTTWSAVVTNSGSTATSYSDNGLTHTTTYTYRVSAINAMGTSSPSSTMSATTLAVVPSSPTGLAATAVSSSQINLSWTSPADNGGSTITGYKIERSIDGGITWSTLIANTGITGTTYSDAGLAHTTAYTYRVSAINSVGTSPPSGAGSATTFAVAPSPPTGLTATAASPSQISLSWTAPDNGGSAVTGYKIERSADGGTTWRTLVANTGSSATTYSDIGLGHTTTYTYRVSAINSVGTGSPSSTASATTPAVAPSPPTGLTATAVSSSQISLSWTAPSDNGGSAITGYKVERSADGGATWTTLVANTGTTASSFSDTGLTHTTTYTYRVSAINSVGTSSSSSTASATTPAVAPSSPTGLTATTVSSSQINLSWTAPTDNGGSAITGYMIERSTDSGTTWTTLVANTGSTATTNSDIGLAHGTTYTYRVSAINSIGTSSPSTTASATTLAVTAAPLNGLTATTVSSSQINLSWAAPADNGGSPVTGYKIERSTDGGTTWSTLIASTGSTATTYSDTGLAHTATYTYRVSSINSVGTSSPSNAASATTLAVVPSSPTGLTATPSSSSQIGLTWSVPADNGGSGITGYKVERSTDGGTTWNALVANTGSTATAYTDTGLTHGTTYTYRVSSINSVGTSSPSSGTSATTLAVVPSSPTGLAATAVSSSQISLTWSVPADNGGSAVTGYKIERSTDGGATWSILVASTASTATAYSDTGLWHTTTYTYRVSAINSVGASSTSNSVSATTLAVAPSSPSAPMAASVSSSQINLSWTAPTDNGGSAITGYKIERSTDGGTTWSTLVANTATAATSYSDTGLAHTTTYTYRVSATNSIGMGSPSGSTSATTLAVVPSSPAGLTATTVSSSQISLSWTAPTDNGGSAITGYKVERSTDGGTTWTTLAANTGSTATSYSDAGLAHTTTYTYRVSAINSVGTGSPSSTAFTTTLAVTASPSTGLAATTVSSSQVNLSWTAPTDNGGSAITGYKVERSIDGGTTWNTLVANTGSAATTYPDTGLGHTTTYTYRVSAINSVGTGSPSNSASATTMAVAPSSPTGLTATAVSPSQIGLTWSVPADNGGSAITGYKVERSTDGGSTWTTLVANTGSPATTYSDTGLGHTTTYTYRVSAINSIGTGSPSTTTSATTSAVAPSSPTGLTATTVSSSQINLSWTAPSDNGGSTITGYKVERSTDGGTTWTTLVANTGSTATSYSDTGLAHTITYTYRVSAINSVGNSSSSTTASATTPAVAPSSPTGLTAATASSSQISLSWTAPADNGGSAITGYMIERSTDGGTTWTTLVANSGSAATTYSDTALAHTTTYTYRVSAITSVGASSSSGTASATTPAVAPSSPTGLTATTVSASQVGLSWTAPSDNGGSAITGYKVERSTDGGTTWTTLVANTGSTATGYSDTGLAHTTTYTYRVSAITSVGTSSASSTASATTPAVAPSPPTGLAATTMSSSQINLSWTAPADNGGSAITGYKVERSTDGGTTWTTLVANTGGAKTTYSDTGLTHTTAYTYRVSAINSIGGGSPSASASATTPAIAPSSPTGLTATTVSSSQISLSWTAPSDNGGSTITGYKVERSTDGGTTWTTIISNSASTATTYSDTGLAPGANYSYRVSAVNSVGASSSSNTATATTLAVAPSAPTGLTATTVSSSQISLSWTAPTDNGGSAITGYKVERSTDGGATWSTLVANTGGTATTYSDTGLTHTSTYAYRVSAINSVGASPPSSTASATTLAVAPSSPTALTATAASSSQINLSWTAPSDNGGSAITGYKVERSTDGGSTWSTLVSNSGSTATVYSDAGLAHSTAYTYRVSAVNSVGNSPPSNTASTTTLAVAPSSPTGLAATTVSSSQINLRWTAPSDNGGSTITGYKVERSADSGSTWTTLVANTGSSSTTYSDTGLAHSTTYTYRVSALNSVGAGSPSSTASATTLAVAPSSPTGLTATAPSSSQINLSWTAPSDNGGSAITGYKVERSTDGGSTWSTLVANTGSAATTYSDAGLTHGTTYTYGVSAINSIGMSSPSSTASATTLAVVPSPPTGLTATAASSSQINLSWTAPGDNGGSAITGYKVERSTDGGGSWTTLVANAASGSTTYSDTGLTHSTTFAYRVSAINSVGASPPSSTASATTLAVAPSSPTGLAATVASSSQINLSWTAPTDNGGSAITGYMIERSTDGGITWSTIVSNSASTATAYSDKGLTPGTTYTYRVSTINSVGTSPPSNSASAKTLAVAPSAPTGLTATAVSSSTINLSWTAPNSGGSPIIGYMVERSTDGGTAWTTIVANSGSTSTTYSNTGLSFSTSYTYRVSAINSMGTSPPSNTASATTNPGTVSLVTSGRVESDSLIQTATQQQLTASPGVWTYDGSAKAAGIPYFFNETSTPHSSLPAGLHIGLKASAPGKWIGFYASVQATATPYPTLFHTLVTAPMRTLPNGASPTTDLVNAGIYVQNGQANLNYIFCGEQTSTTGTIWQVDQATGNATQAKTFKQWYQDTSLNQPLTRECTIITNGANYLEVYIDNRLVYRNTTFVQSMAQPFIAFLETQTSYAGRVLYGSFSNYYATTSESVVVNNLPAGATTAQIIDSTGTVLTTAPVTSGSVTFFPSGGATSFNFPLKGKIVVYGQGNVVLATTSTLVSINGGDAYSVS